MNWGKGIVGGMVVFMLFILSMCVYMFRAPADEYDHQYYEKGLGFNGDYNRQKQVATDHATPEICQDGNTLMLTFTARVSGSLKFIRPSSKALDKTFPLNSGPYNYVAMPLKSMPKGQWQLVVEWETDKKAYLYQTAIYIK